MNQMCRGCFFENNDWDECFDKQYDPNVHECEDFVLPEDVDIWGGEYDD